MIGTAISVLLGAAAWSAIRFGANLSNEPAKSLGLKISFKELAKRVMWSVVVILCAVPVWIGLTDSPLYMDLLVPFLAGTAGLEILANRLEKRQSIKRLKEKEIKKTQRKKD